MAYRRRYKKKSNAWLALMILALAAVILFMIMWKPQA